MEVVTSKPVHKALVSRLLVYFANVRIRAL